MRTQFDYREEKLGNLSRLGLVHEGDGARYQKANGSLSSVGSPSKAEGLYITALGKTLVEACKR